MLSLLLSVVCQAEPWTERFIVKFEENAVFSNQSFSIKCDRHTLPDITETNGYVVSESLLHDNQDYGVKTTIIESTFWQWLYITHLLTGYELTLNTKIVPLCSNSYSWLPLAVVVAVVWLLKNYWNLDSLSLKSMEQKEITPMLTQVDLSFAMITMITGSGRDQHQGQPSESSGWEASGATIQLKGSSFRPLGMTDYGGGKGEPQQQSHTLDLNCFVHPCHGFCQLRLSSDNRGSVEWSLNSSESSCPHLSDGHCFSCIGHFDSLNITQVVYKNTHYEPLNLHSFPGESGTSSMLTHSETQQTPTASSQLGQSQAHPVRKGTTQALSDRKSEYHTEQSTCGVKIVGDDGRQHPCGIVCKNAAALRDHKKIKHTGQKTCDAIVVGKNGQQQSCGKTSKNAKAMSVHKSAYHTGQKTCDVTVIGEDGQQYPCGTVCKNTNALSNHKKRKHTGQKTCDMPMIGKNGEQQSCGKICKNVKALSVHKSLYHTGQKICDITIIAGDGRQRPCGAVCKNTNALFNHKKRDHSGQQTCDMNVVDKDGQPRPCGMLCRNIQVLSNHKRSAHGKRQICYLTVVGKDGQQRPCGKISKNLKALSDHKRVHRKRKPVDLD